MKNHLIVQNWGSIDYAEAWKRQGELQQELISIKRQRKKGLSPEGNGKHYLIFCQHPHVYTLGKSGSEDHLLVDENFLESHEVSYYKINRGGDITYHGPGQWVVYPILDLELIYTDIHRYIRALEEVIILVMRDLGLSGYRVDDYTGVWIGDLPRRKICAIGVHLSRWVSMHGLAFNINTDLNYFKNIVPCGIQEDNKEVTSLSAELGRSLDMKEVQQMILSHFLSVFQIQEQK